MTIDPRMAGYVERLEEGWVAGVRGPRAGVRCGFSMTELLVVVAILAILFGLTLAAVGRSRARAEAVVCANQLRGVITDALRLASSNGGYLPLSGRIQVSAGAGTVGGADGLARALGDPGRQRYRYYRPPADEQAYLPFAEGAVPFVLAVAEGHFDRSTWREAFPDLRQSLEEYVRRVPAAARLVCPTERPGEADPTGYPLDYAIVYDTSALITPDLVYVPRGYAVNAALLSFDAAAPRSRTALRGRLGAIGGSSGRFVVIGEGDGRGVNWSVRAGAEEEGVTLLDVERRPEVMDGTVRWPGVARNRHSGGFNAAFADGSVRLLRGDVDLAESVLVYGRAE